MSANAIVFGIHLKLWEEAKGQARLAIIEAIQQCRPTISYSVLVQKISAVDFTPDDLRLPRLLEEITIEEYKAGRGMLTVVVVHNDGDLLPGIGFFHLARRLGYDVKDRKSFWITEIEKVKNYWLSVNPSRYPSK